MEIFIGANDTRPPLQAKRWIPRKRYAGFLADLETWIREKETQWGNCYLFIEVPLPRPKGPYIRHNQIDLLICFPDRAALCELKLTSHLKSMDVDYSRRQITTQSD